MQTENVTEKTEPKKQFILDEEGNLQEILKEKCKIVEHPVKYKLKNAFEVFVRVEGTENYWISNYGRCINNLNHKDKNAFYEHKQGKCHYTVFEIERQLVSYPLTRTKRGKKMPDKRKEKLEQVISTNISETECNSILEERQRANERRLYLIRKIRYKRDTEPADLVKDAFLVKYGDRSRIWHKDGNESNNWYKNLLTVTPQDYKRLKADKVTWQELNLEQEYIEYENKASGSAYKVYNGILARCRSEEPTNAIHKCYNETIMCQEWKDNPKSFVKWYLEHYYECENESMHVDKDLFGEGSNMYHPDYCCILPQGLNTLLSNCKKHYRDGENPDNVLPLGVSYNGKSGKYFGRITFTGAENPIILSEWDTKEEAFQEYSIMKKADILLMAAKYKNKVPKKVYDALLKIEVRPYERD